MTDVIQFPEVPTIKPGHCHCGCGELAPVARKTSARLGHVKGRPVKFIHNHHARLGAWQAYVSVESSGCWEWTKGKNADGYGVLMRDRRSWMAHRFVYTELVGEIPKGLLCCHSCDNPGCVNPNHIFLGTAKDNNDDALRKRRKSFKLSIEEESHLVYDRQELGFTYAQLGQKYGLTDMGAFGIVKRMENQDV